MRKKSDEKWSSFIGLNKFVAQASMGIVGFIDYYLFNIYDRDIEKSVLRNMFAGFCDCLNLVKKSMKDIYEGNLWKKYVKEIYEGNMWKKSMKEICEKNL